MDDAANSSPDLGADSREPRVRMGVAGSEAPLRGRVAVVTGATSGVGRSTAIALGRLGAVLVLVGRNARRAQRVLDHLVEPGGSTPSEFVHCDLSNVSEVTRVTPAILEKHERIDILVNNAHARFERYQASPDGIEMTFATNHIGHYVLTLLLLPALLASAEARVVTVAGEAHRWGSPDFEECLRPAAFDRHRALASSKLANVAFSFDLAQRLRGTGVCVNAVHPGIVATRAGSGGRLLPLLKHYVYYGLRGALVSPRRGVASVVRLCAAPELRGVSGKYFDREQLVEPSSTACDPEVARRLWALSSRLARIEVSLPILGNSGQDCCRAD